MSDKQIVETFRKLKEHCLSKKDCDTCRFYRIKDNYSGYCQLEEIGWIFSVCPKYWDLEKIERLIND